MCNVNFYVFCRQQEAPDLFEWLCIEELRLCCPPGHFGSDCKGGKNRQIFLTCGVYNSSMAYFFPTQSVHQALAVCVAAWAAARGRGLVWAMESVSVTPDTPAICARTAPTATSERSALMKAWEPVQVVANPRPEETPV